jgi:signal transduction histidine kinase
MERSVLRGLAVFRWAAWVWMATVLVLARRALVQPVLAAGLVVAALVVTVWITVLLRRDEAAVRRPAVVGTEVAVALSLLVADGFVYRAPHVFQPEQPLGVAWPTAVILSAGIAVGAWGGAATGVAFGAARALSSILNVGEQGPDAELIVAGLTPQQTLSLVTTAVLFALAGAVAGHAMGLLRAAEERITRAERRVAESQAREEVARELHDGVLQTLAAVERRTGDPQLARLARDQERDLRTYLLGAAGRASGHGSLDDALRHVARRAETTFGTRVEVLVADDLPPLEGPTVEAVAGAVGEALTNAGKHGEARRAVVYVEPTETGLFCSVRDDGAGFDPARVVEGVGLPRSIRGRITELGGAVEIDSAPGRGTEVRLRLPLGAPRPPTTP